MKTLLVIVAILIGGSSALAKSVIVPEESSAAAKMMIRQILDKNLLLGPDATFNPILNQALFDLKSPTDPTKWVFTKNSCLKVVTEQSNRQLCTITLDAGLDDEGFGQIFNINVFIDFGAVTSAGIDKKN